MRVQRTSIGGEWQHLGWIAVTRGFTPLVRRERPRRPGHFGLTPPPGSVWFGPLNRRAVRATLAIPPAARPAAAWPSDVERKVSYDALVVGPGLNCCAGDTAPRRGPGRRLDPHQHDDHHD